MKLNEIRLTTTLDSRSQPTLQAEMFSADFSSLASVPSGASVGSNEAVSIGTDLVVDKFHRIKKRLLDHDFSSPEQFDRLLIELDGTDNKSNLGANLTLSLSIAFTKLLAKNFHLPTYRLLSQLAGLTLQKFPLLFVNLIEGGMHAKNSLPFQEYLYIALDDSPLKNLEQTQQFIVSLRELFEREGRQLTYGDEGGFTMTGDNPASGLEILSSLLSDGARLGLDIAASTFFKNGSYVIGQQTFSSAELLGFYQNLVNRFDLLSIEDPFSENDPGSFSALRRILNGKVWIVGDDLTVTNTRRIEAARERAEIDAVIIKPNQIGTVSETVAAVLLCKKLGLKTIVSHRSGETEDAFIADFAVGLQADGLKSGCPLQKYRLIKYQRLIAIENELKLKRDGQVSDI